uniref:GDP-mannose 4,6-dehydratase n=1 Tax=Florenciella sp. virus SA2 TaxID=3240092 RepID=A0AB39JCE0_9VIRU
MDICRICKSKSLSTVIDLKTQKNTSVFNKYGEHDKITSYPVKLFICESCGLIQMAETTPPDDMYKTNNYGYLSSISNTMRTHLMLYHEEILTKIKINKGDIVLDIGSNDSTFLHYYDSNIRRIGIDPTGNQFKQYYHDLELISDYFTLDNVVKNIGTNNKCKIITSICMFYDLPDPVQFAKDIYELLDEDGIWTCEQSYLLDMLKTNSLDTICHEHLEYYALTQIVDIAKRANLKIIDVKFNSSNGGSFRIYFTKKENLQFDECSQLINKILEEEFNYKIKEKETYINFMKSCDNELKKLTDIIHTINDNGQKSYIYGASTKGNCILQYCNITEDNIRYAVERNPDKIGLSTSTGIEIISEETMRENPPEYLIVLPWHFKDEIIKREQKYLDEGGQLIFYFPTFEIISKKPKLLITGCDGFIGNYIKEYYKEYTLYGITRTKRKVEKEITKFFFDINDYNQLDNTIKIINPASIIHLSGISSSIEAFKEPLKTIQDNGMVTVNLCDIIYKNNKKIKLFNASSSEIYKDYQSFNVNEYDNINHFLHSHPYSIAKILGQQTVKFYRETYNLHFSSGILFNTQSIKKSDKFLLNKIYSHLKSESNDPLITGSLNSYRNIIHPYDVINSIKYILNNDHGDDYNICGYNSYKIKDLVFKLYEKFNINLINGENPNIYYDKETNKPRLIIEDLDNGIDTKTINITAYPCKLRALNWEIKYSIEDIFDEFN